MTKVLITGGTGMIGEPLTEQLLNAGYEVRHMSRKKRGVQRVPTFLWDPKSGKMDEAALEGVDYIIHLAGAGIVDKPWTDERKQEILDSRIKTAELLLQTCKLHDVKLKAFISASAIGYYPLTVSDLLYTEDSPSGKGFLADVCVQWEAAADAFEGIAERVVKLRIGLVLDRGKGALKRIETPVRMYVAAGLGSGEQAMSWIHVQDLCRMFVHSVENNLEGVYNAVGPDTITNNDFMQILADVMEKPLILPNIPEFIVRLLFKDTADMILKGVKLSSSKILETGFEFDYPTLNSALMHIYSEH